MADLIMRSVGTDTKFASHIHFAYLDLQEEVEATSINDKSINNLPLFLLDVNVNVLQTTKASFQCTRRNQTPKF